MKKYALLFLIVLAGSIQDAHRANADDCDRPMSAVERRQNDCDEDNFKSKEKFDAESGLEVIEYKKDLDWKVAKPKIPWSRILKFKSALDGGYELAVFDRDYTDSFSSGAKEGVVTR